MRDLYPNERHMVPIPKMMTRYMTDLPEFERIRRRYNGVVHGMEEADAADLHDAANRLHEMVEEIIRRNQQDPPV